LYGEVLFRIRDQSVQESCSAQFETITWTQNPEKIMQYNIATILAIIAILFVLLTYITGAPLVPVAVILLGLAIIFGGNTFRRV
jgi:type IV secretory pathway VirB2 component (pilin)